MRINSIQEFIQVDDALPKTKKIEMKKNEKNDAYPLPTRFTCKNLNI